MSATIISGKALAASIRKDVRSAIETTLSGPPPQLISLAVGDPDPASRIYLASQIKIARKVGIDLKEHLLPANMPEPELCAQIETVNHDDQIDGIMIQRPLPPGIDAFRLIGAVDPPKDVEGVHPVNLGAIAHGHPGLVPCTAEAAIRLFRTLNQPAKGLEVVVVGHSEIVGKPIALLLVHELATVTLCHIGTRDLELHTKRADLLFVAAGVPGLIGAEAVKPGAVVIDIGINAIPAGDGKTTRIVGDVDFEEVSKKAGAITPVPGGVGPVTTAVLMENTLKAARQARR